jgi:hypothetical protein
MNLEQYIIKELKVSPTKHQLEMIKELSLSFKEDKKGFNNYSIQVKECVRECIKSFPKHLHPKKDKEWLNVLDTIDKLNRIELLPFEAIVNIVKKTREDSFWSSNFLSLNKLRKRNKEGIYYITVFYERLNNNKPKRVNIDNLSRIANERYGNTQTS